MITTVWFDLDVLRGVDAAAKWAQFPVSLAVLLPYHFAEETLLGPVENGKRCADWRRPDFAAYLVGSAHGAS